nr:inorganic phosphate transporter [Brevibacterium otitidis]
MELRILVVLVIVLALFFYFTNGFHDTANAMATPIATEVAKTISGGLINEGEGGVHITPQLILAGLVGAIVWNMITWIYGLPSSSSHALFGGLIGAALIGAGLHAVNFSVVLSKVIIPAVAAPVIAGTSALVCTRLAYRITRRYANANRRCAFKYGQVFSSSLVALAHGTNDAQKTMGVIATCAFAIALGTKLTEVRPAQGLAAETSAAAAILASSHLGFALSTTQVASGSVLGSGLGRSGADVKWGTAGRIATGWLFTLPAAGAVGAVAALVSNLGF